MILYFFLEKIIRESSASAFICINAQRNVCPRTAMFTKTLFSFLFFPRFFFLGISFLLISLKIEDF